jgi:hypothetical protein
MVAEARCVSGRIIATIDIVLMCALNGLRVLIAYKDRHPKDATYINRLLAICDFIVDNFLF